MSKLITKFDEFKTTYPECVSLKIPVLVWKGKTLQEFLFDQCMYDFSYDMLSMPPEVYFSDATDKTLVELYIQTLDK